MGKEMNKWEVEYNERKAKVDSMIAERDNKINEARRKMAELGGNINSPEYKKFKEQLKNAQLEKRTLEEFKRVIPEIDHVIEYRDKLQLDLEDLKREQKIRENLAKADSKMQEDEKRIDELQEKAGEIAKKLRNPNLTDEEKAQLETEKDKIKEELTSVQTDRQVQQDYLEKGLTLKRKFVGLSQEELESKINNGNEEIKKCNSVAHSLYKGERWEKIEQKLANWDEPSKREEGSKKDRKQHVEEFMDKYNPEEIEEDLEEEIEEDLEEDLEEETIESSKSEKPALTFADKHPRLAKIGNFFKGIKDKFIKKGKEETKNTETKEPDKKEEKPVEDKKTGEKAQETKGITDKFYDRIKEVAEKGYVKADEDKEAARKDDLRARLTAFREQNGYGPKSGEEIVFTQKGRDALREIDDTVRRIQEEQEGPEL